MSRILQCRWSVIVIAIAVVMGPAARAATFTDDFAVPDGDPDWFVHDPTVRITGEELLLERTAGIEPAVWVGSFGEPIWFDAVASVRFRIHYGAGVEPGIGAHGGVILCARDAATRWNNPNYTVDWIQRDGVYRIMKATETAQIGVATAPAAAPAEDWRIDFTETGLTFQAGGEEIATVDAPDLRRSGYIGFWAYQNEGQQMYIDDVVIESTPGACPHFQPATISIPLGGEAALTVRLPFGANDPDARTVTLRSSDPAVAGPVGGVDGAVDLTFDPGASLTQTLQLEGAAPGRVRLGVDDPACGDAGPWIEVLSAAQYTEDFTQADGPPEGWYVAAPAAAVAGEELSLTPGPGEPHAWAGLGGQALSFRRLDAVRFRIRFAAASAPILAHGGILVATRSAGTRQNSGGYMIDVLERDGVYRINKNYSQVLATAPAPANDEAFHDWAIDFTDTGFTFSVDGGEVLVIDDTEFRGGYVGFWCYTNGGQNVRIDDLQIDFQTGSCPAIAPAAVSTRPVNPNPVFTVTIPFGKNLADAYAVTVTSSDPTIAAPVGHTDGSLVLDFEAGGPLTQTFEAEVLDNPGTAEFVLSVADAACAGVAAQVEVREPGEPFFADDFAEPDGPPQNWTIFDGDWQVAGEALTGTRVGGGENWIWAGAPAVRIEGAATYRFTLDLANEAPDAVGRHGGFMFFAGDPTQRWVTSGYEIDWIDRTDDHGYRFLRSDNGVHTGIAGPTFGDFELGTDWRLEVDGENLRFYVDDQLIFDVVDATYREGYLGFWTYGNGTSVAIDDVAIGEAGPIFLRADTDGDGILTIGDGIQILERLFVDREAFGSNCEATGDLDDSGDLTIGDAIWQFNYLFAGGEDPAPPHRQCGVDPTPDELGCEGYPTESCPE